MAIEKNSQGTIENVTDFAERWGWDIPIGRDSWPTQTVYGAYETERDNYFVIDQEGNVVYRAIDFRFYNGTGWSAHKQQIIDAVATTVGVPVETTTWGGIKSLYLN